MDRAPALAAEPWRPPHPAAAGGANRAAEPSSAVTGQSSGSRGAGGGGGRRRQREPPASEDDSARLVSTSGGQDLADSEVKRFKANKSSVSDDNGSFRKDAEDSRNASKAVDQNPPPPEPPKQDFIHVRARRGQATDSHSLAERARREKITERMKILQDLVPGCNKVIGKASVLDEIINYVQSLERQIEFLSMKLEAVNAHVSNGAETFPPKDYGAPTYNTAPGLTFDPQTPREYAQGSPASEWLHMQIGGTYERVT